MKSYLIRSESELGFAVMGCFDAPDEKSATMSARVDFVNRYGYRPVKVEVIDVEEV